MVLAFAVSKICMLSNLPSHAKFFSKQSKKKMANFFILEDQMGEDVFSLIILHLSSVDKLFSVQTFQRKRRCVSTCV